MLIVELFKDQIHVEKDNLPSWALSCLEDMDSIVIAKLGVCLSIYIYLFLRVTKFEMRINIIKIEKCNRKGEITYSRITQDTPTHFFNSKQNLMIPNVNIDTTESIQGKLIEENVVESSTQIPSQLEYLEFNSLL